jgi:tetratricopeptide (TPR) repeat protein
MSALTQPSRSHEALLLLTVLALGVLPAHGADQHWNRISSDHFSVLTDAGSQKGHEIAARFEQMRAVFGELLMRKQVRMSKPIEIIAVASTAEYSQLSPSSTTHPVNSPGFFLPEVDRVFIVLNAADPDCWRAIEHPLAHYFLNYNYPPTQPWFDEGMAQYFSSLYFTAQKTELGSDPELPPPGQASGVASAALKAKSLTEILQQTPWLSLPDLLETKRPALEGGDATHPTIFEAQSWILIHYLIARDKLSETGAYFGLIELQKIPVAQAVQQAFGMSLAQLDSAVKDYFHSFKLAPASLEQSKQHPATTPPSPNESPLPFSIDDVGVSSKPVPLPEAQALLDEMELRIPEKRERAAKDLENLVSGERTETAAADRGLSWVQIQKGDIKDAFEELNSAMRINSSDPWTRFELALASYHSGEKGAKVQGLANMMESLQIAIDRYPEFAEAYNMLGWARLTGGGANAAVETMKMAVQLAPRSEPYQLRLAQAYVAARKWEEGNSLLARLEGSQDPQIVAGAKKELYELPYLKKFGIPPQEEPAPQRQLKAQATNTPESKPPEADDNEEETSREDTDNASPKAAATPRMDKRPIQFLKGKLVSVDCSAAPAAIVLVSKGPRTLKLRTADYKSLLVMGADKFSCDWKDVPIDVNYRAGGNAEGDLVSIELR